jgi:hypothetical protein
MDQAFDIACVVGKKPIYDYPWTPHALATFRNITNASKILFVSDGTLEESDRDSTPIPSAVIEPAQEEIVAERLAPYPHLKRTRDVALCWRKLVDVAIISQSKWVLLCDAADIFVREKVTIPVPSEGSFTYIREDIPGYHAKTFSAFREPIVKGCNTGFVLFRPEDVDLEFLEYICEHHLPNLRDLWWSEQYAFGLLAARTRPRYWIGTQVRVVSGLGMRSDEEMSADVVKWWAPKKRVMSDAELSPYLGNAAVVHLAGTSKPFYRAAMEPIPSSDPPLSLSSKEDRALNFGEQILFSMRLAYKNTTQFVSEKRHAQG